MADIYVDLALTGSGNTGADWANAYEGAAGLATACGAASAGDDIWVKNTISENTASRVFSFTNGTIGNPVRVYGVKAATSAEPPTQSDLIPGHRTGDATAAYAQTSGNAPPSIDVTGGARDVDFEGFGNWYGVVFKCTGDLRVLPTTSIPGKLQFEECRFNGGNAAVNDRHLIIGGSAANIDVVTAAFTNCAFGIGSNADNSIQLSRGALVRMVNCLVDGTASGKVFTGDATNEHSSDLLMEACDLSNQTGTIFDVTNFGPLSVIVKNCSHGTGATLVSGTSTSPYRIEMYNFAVNPGTPLASGDSQQDFTIATNEGDTTLETTAVRTGGATDGKAGAFSWAMTPNVNSTVENVLGMRSHDLAKWVDGDGTSKTITIYIANSGAGDYNDDDVSLEVIYPSATGKVMHDVTDTRMALLGTPAAITDDTGSTWGTGGNNHQKIEVAISPDYSGWVYLRVFFCKRFASSPETLYVDPEMNVA